MTDILSELRDCFQSPEKKLKTGDGHYPLTNFPSSRPLVNGKEGRKIEPVRLADQPEPGPRVDLVEGIIPKGFPSLLYGDGGQGKSYLALALATAVSSGQSFIGLQCKQTPVLYVDWELDLEEHTRRAYAVARGMGLFKPSRELFYLRAEDQGLALVDSIGNFAVREGIGFIVFDSFGAACGGDQRPEVVIPFLTALRDLKATTLGLEHQAKLQEGQDASNKTPYGSAFKFNLARSVIHCQKVAGKCGELSLILKHKKFNFGVLKEGQPIKLLFQDASVSVEKGDLTTDSDFIEHLPTDQRIEQSLREDGPATAKTLAERLGVTAKTVANITSRLKKDGKISETGKEGHAPIYAPTNFPISLAYSGKEDGKKTFDQDAAIQATGEWAQEQMLQPEVDSEKEEEHE